MPPARHGNGGHIRRARAQQLSAIALGSDRSLPNRQAGLAARGGCGATESRGKIM